MSVTLSNEIVQKMGVGAVFRGSSSEEAQEPITSLDFHYTGSACATACADGSIQLLNAQEGRSMKTVHSKKYGVELIRFTHHNQTLIFNMRYLSLYDNKYIRFFTGHTDRVVSLAMSPVDDTFMSAAIDGTVRLWDVRQDTCRAVMQLPDRITSNPLVAQDPTGLVFAVCTGQEVKMFDAREYEQGPFATFDMNYEKTKIDAVNAVGWVGTSMQFSTDGGSLLLGTDHNVIMRIDGYEGDLKNKYVGHATVINKRNKSLPFTPCFSPDLKYVLSGSNDGRVLAWDTESGAKVAEWQEHVGPVHSVQWSPLTAMFASTCFATIFWTHQPE